MDQDDINGLISKSCPDWKADQIRHANGCYNKREKPLNNLEKIRLYKQLKEEIDISTFDFILCLHTNRLDENMSYSAWKYGADMDVVKTMVINVHNDGSTYVVTTGDYTEDEAETIQQHIADWLTI